MLRGVRKPEEAQALGLSRRMSVRLGALLKKGLELTPAVLEAARPGSPLEVFLLDPRFLERAAALDAEALRSLASACLPAEGNPRPQDLALHFSPEGARVLCLAEELEAGADWGRAETPAAAPAPDIISPPPACRVARLSAGGPAQAGGAGRADPKALMPVRAPGESWYPARPEGAERTAEEALFTPVELERTRLRLVTSVEAAERIEALRILLHAPATSPPERAELLLRGLADRDSAVRAEAARLLPLLGVAAETSEALEALGQGTEEARAQSAGKLARLLAGTEDRRPGQRKLERGAAALCALAALRAEGTGRPAEALLNLLAACAPALSDSPEQLSEILRAGVRVLEAPRAPSQPQSSAGARQTAVRRLVRALLQAAPETAREQLQAELLRSENRTVSSLLLQLLLESAPPGSPLESSLLAQSARFLAQDQEESQDARALGLSMAGRGEAALSALAEIFSTASLPAQRHLLALMEDVARFHKCSPDARRQAAEQVRAALDSPHRAVRAAAAGCRFVTAADLPAALREKLAAAFLNVLPDFGFRADLEVAEETAALFGPAMVPAVLERTAAERTPALRVQAVRILGRLALELRPAAKELRETGRTVDEILRALQKLSLDERFPDRRALCAALGKAGVSPAASREATDVVTRHLQTLADAGEKCWFAAAEGLSWLAASRRAKPPLILNVAARLRRILDAAQADVRVEAKSRDGQRVLEFSETETQVDLVPIALQGLSRIARGPVCPASLLRELIQDLASYWRRLGTGELVWGPVNSLCLVQVLGDLGCHAAVSDAQRLELLKALAPRLVQTPVLRAVTAILAASDSPYNAPAALSIGLAIAGRRQEGRFDPEDRPEILKSLAAIASRRCLGSSGHEGNQEAARFRSAVLDDLFQGAHDLLAAAREALFHLRDARVLPTETQAALEKRLAGMYGLAAKE